MTIPSVLLGLLFIMYALMGAGSAWPNECGICTGNDCKPIPCYQMAQGYRDWLDTSDYSDEHCFAVNCQDCNTCVETEKGSGLFNCTLIACPPICDEFCVRGVLKPADREVKP